jgi:hypothetical protein
LIVTFIKPNANISSSESEGERNAQINLQTFQLIVNYICLLNVEGALDAPAIFGYNVALPNSKQAKPYKLIVGCMIAILNSTSVHVPPKKINDSKTSLSFHDDCGIFCEGDWANANNGSKVVVQQQSNLPSLLSMALAISTLAALVKLDASAPSDTWLKQPH